MPNTIPIKDAEKIKAWVNSPEGQAAIKKSVEDSAQMVKELQEAMRIDPEQLRRPMTK